MGARAAACDHRLDAGMSALPHLREAGASLARGDATSALAAADRALVLDPGSADGWNLRGLARFHLGDFAGAREALETAVIANPRYANAWRNLAAACEAQGDASASARAYAQSVVVARGAGAADWYDAGLRALRVPLLSLAGECLERALAIDARHEGALNALLVVRDREHRPHDARAVARRLLAVAPESLVAMHGFAAVFSQATEPVDLAQGLDQALRIIAREPRHAAAHDCAAIIHGKLGAIEPALQHAREAVRHAPAIADFAYTLGRLLEENGRLEEADNVITSARTHTTSSARLLREHGTVKLRRGALPEAIVCFDEALRVDPADQTAIAQRALALRLNGETERARRVNDVERFIERTTLAVPAPFGNADAFNAALAHDIRQHSRLRFEPVGLAAKGGYLTEDLLADRTPAIVGFEQALRAAIDRYIARFAATRHDDDASHPFLRSLPREYRLNLWATRVAEQGSIGTHLHEESWLSGAYYVALPPALDGDATTAGWIEFGRPHARLPQPPEDDVIVLRPAVGDLLLFPSYLYHRTLPFAGAGERISISFDLSPR
jgi:uncharacterized protein (TIGR02466 family)